MASTLLVFASSAYISTRSSLGVAHVLRRSEVSWALEPCSEFPPVPCWVHTPATCAPGRSTAPGEAKWAYSAFSPILQTESRRHRVGIWSSVWSYPL